MQRSPGSHGAPAGSGVVVQLCAASSQVTSWHASGIIPQSFSGPPTHTPASLQVSSTVQNKPSSQAAPSSGTTTHSPTAPWYCPSLQTDFTQGGVTICEQSVPQGPGFPPLPPPLP